MTPKRKTIQLHNKDQIDASKDVRLLQSLLYLQELKKLQKIFRKNKIDFLILKGLPLNLFYEHAFPKRVYGDCDILINRKDLAIVEKLLSILGYQQDTVSPLTFPAFIKGRDTEISFRKFYHGFPVIFDIHLEAVFLMTQTVFLNSLYNQKLLAAFSSELLFNKRNITVHGNTFPVLRPEYLFIYLCLHLCHHGFRGSYRYELIDKVVRTEKIDYTKISMLLRSYQLEGFIYPTLLLLEKHYHSPIDKSFLEKNKMPWYLDIFPTRWLFPQDISREKTGIAGGRERAKLIFILSESPLWKKLLICLDPRMLFLILWVICKTVMLSKQAKK